MTYNLNNNEDLIRFFNMIFHHEKLVRFAPKIMQFFIITRNFGLINYKDNIAKLVKASNNDFTNLVIETIKDGFIKRNIKFTDENLITFLITNYHANGFYFHSFPGVYENSIKEHGILASRRNETDEKYYQIAEKYHFGEYFVKPNNRICFSEKLDNRGTCEYSILTPEWLYLFLQQGNRDINDIFIRGDIEELKPIIENALVCFKNGMERNPQYQEKDYQFLETYINDIVTKRFANGNNVVGIALIEKQKGDEYLKKHVAKQDIPDFIKYIKSRNMNANEIVDFVIEVLSKGEVISEKNIPKELVSIVSYQIKNNLLEEKRVLK